MKKALNSLLVPFMLMAAMSAKGQIITTVVGDGAGSYAGDGEHATAASCNGPREVDVDQYGNLYIADAGNNVIRKVNISTNLVSTVAGNGTAGYSGDNGAAISATLFKPSWVSVDNEGNLYIADIGNYVVRKVNTSGIITTIAGTGTNGYTGDGLKAASAELGWPFAVVPDNAGNIYISDYYNNNIRKINSAGIISTYAGTGTGGYSGDGGGAVSARLSTPAGMCIDASKNLYIADYSNKVIRKVTSGGIISTVAGNGTNADAGDGGNATAASFLNPISVTVDPDGNLFISDPGASRIRYVQSSSGTISTYAGDGTPGYSGDGGHGYSAEVNNPAGAKVAFGNFFFADQNNNVIRVVSGNNFPVSGVKQVTATITVTELLPDPNKGIFTVKGSLSAPDDETVALEVTNVLGQSFYKNTVVASKGVLNTQITLSNNLSNGLYFLHVVSGAGSDVIRFVVDK
jgi:hypothetical protein